MDLTLGWGRPTEVLDLDYDKMFLAKDIYLLTIVCPFILIFFLSTFGISFRSTA